MEITGWGKVLKVGGEKKRSLSSPVSLQEAEVPIISQKSCQDDSVSNYPFLFFCIFYSDVISQRIKYRYLFVFIGLW